jgi:D-alanyl-D-alanine carboxypeptidase/D-alanyl-D-alanine-endopeptidase (penicillin-binding protein 4)
MNALLAAFLLAGAVRAQEASLPEAIDALVEGFKVRDARVGVAVHSTRAGRPVYERAADEPLRLASNTKLFTTAAALALLGSEFRFRTSLGLAGEDLHVFGGGDPNLSGRFHDGDPLAVFRLWAGRLREAGVRRVRHLVLHTGIFEDRHLNPGWREYDLWWWWSAPFGALSFNDNCVDLEIAPAAEGQPCRVRLSPPTSYVTIVNQTRSTSRPKRPFGFTRAPGTNTITLRGDVAGRAEYSVAVHDPTRYFGTVLRETLQAAGIAVEGELLPAEDGPEEVPGFRELAFWESDLPRTIAACNQLSQNFYAEMLLRTLGWKKRGKGTLENGLAAVGEFLEREVGLSGVSLKDGSGLTRDNQASAAEVVRLLLYMRGHRHAREFLESLPANGAPKGTLRNRLAAPDLRGRLRAKTGHLSGVSTLSGYAESLGGDVFVFSILVNTPEGTAGADRLQDRIAELLLRHRGE